METATTHLPLDASSHVALDHLVRELPVPAETRDASRPSPPREWLVTNGLGGYASGTVSGIPARRYHALLIAALPAPVGRLVILSQVGERVRLNSGRHVWLNGEREPGRGLAPEYVRHLTAFRLEAGLPVWTYDIEGSVIEKRLLLPHHQNSVHVTYALRGGPPVRLGLRPLLHARPHEAAVNHPLPASPCVTARNRRIEVELGEAPPPLKLFVTGSDAAFTVDPSTISGIEYATEGQRGYEREGEAWSPGYFRVELTDGAPITFVASLESWDTATALSPDEARGVEIARRRQLVATAGECVVDATAAELVLAADQFIVTPAGRAEEAARARAAGEEARTVIAGYHWFTDWGRDTMISLEGLTLVTGRKDEARAILRTFARHFRHGLIPNLFPEGDREGLYHTADATLWFFHALDRYVTVTGDTATVDDLLPVLDDSLDHHLRGTAFNIGVDPGDGLLRQGAEGYQLTWMDAKVEGWVVTPRRGKAVEINALYYNALRLTADWHEARGNTARAAELRRWAERANASFNARFWFEQGQYLYDVVDGEDGDDAACRPNQVFAISLRYPVLARERWEPVLRTVEQRLLTPVGLRSLDPAHPDYKAQYYGDLRARDAAYHQGTVWGWLIGPFVDAWLKLHPDDRRAARRYLEGFVPHLNEACVGSISEIFDATDPFTPRGCIAQAWSVAEVLRGWTLTAGA